MENKKLKDKIKSRLNFDDIAEATATSATLRSSYKF